MHFSAWGLLTLAGLFEIVWAVLLKHTQGFSRPLPSVVTIAAMFASFWFLSRALESIPVGTAYAVWTGIGAVGTALIGVLWLGEPRSTPRLLCIGLIVVGILGLRLLGPRPAAA
ncbi:MAG: multidrug efflux SMR transporter [Gemmatimonadetes bacterium]|nr:multidrug efflux SMR transporter [Gemmatimonadota bacterium]